MKKRIAYISLYFFTVLLIFILQKPLFMLYNGSIEKGFGFADYMQVMILMEPVLMPLRRDILLHFHSCWY